MKILYKLESQQQIFTSSLPSQRSDIQLRIHWIQLCDSSSAVQRSHVLGTCHLDHKETPMANHACITETRLRGPVCGQQNRACNCFSSCRGRVTPNQMTNLTFFNFDFKTRTYIKLSNHLTFHSYYGGSV